MALSIIALPIQGLLLLWTAGQDFLSHSQPLSPSPLLLITVRKEKGLKNISKNFQFIVSP